MNRSRRRSRKESGQALVEGILVLPLTLFMILGTLQLFMLLQARIMAQYAVYSATRAGSLNKGDCTAMRHAAILALLPTFEHIWPGGGNGWGAAANLQAAFVRHQDNRYHLPGFNAQITEMVREQPTPGAVASLPWSEDLDFDSSWETGRTWRLETRMVYWYEMRIPFANWVISRIFLATFGLQAPPQTDPLMPANGQGNQTVPRSSLGWDWWPGGSLGANMLSWSRLGPPRFMYPIQVASVMQMMTPPSKTFFPTNSNGACPL